MEVALSKVALDRGSSSDSELVHAARNGDHRALAELLKRYQDLIHALAFAITGSVSQSDEVTQETFVTAWRRLHEMEQPERLRGWLCGIARVIAKHSRYQTARQRSAHSRWSAFAATPALEPSPLDRALVEEERKMAWRALEAVPESYRVPLVLFYMQQRSVQKVAEALDISEPNVRVRLNRGRKILQDRVTAILESAVQAIRPSKELAALVLAAVAAAETPASAAAA